MHYGMKLALVALTLVGTPVLAEEAKPAPAAKSQGDTTLTLKKGAHQTLNVPGLVRIALGDPDVADVRAEGKGVVKVTGKKAGETKLITWAGPENTLQAYNIVVQD
ncbi:pilus assembly protein N-terminal domain-containing protein [Myxococcus sp. Y35]|uniref:pilus assembly protein N-terminal domain-containing protein n=1 Tax=Pseudomyxococcus flavus TaxID=3115648 RepID=UPI003CF0D0B0